MAAQQPRLPANIPQNLLPSQPTALPSVQDIGEVGQVVHKLRSASG